MDQRVKIYLSEIGRVGGKKSKRSLSSETAKQMVKVREARRAYKKYYVQCFWSFDPEYKIELKDLKWVSDQLKKQGDLMLWQLGVKICP